MNGKAQSLAAKLLGKGGAKKSDGFPTLSQLGEAALVQLKDPLYDRGANDKGIGIQLGVSLVKVFSGFAMATLIGVPLGFLIGGSKRAWAAANPVIQVLRPVSPLAWFPIGLVVLTHYRAGARWRPRIVSPGAGAPIRLASESTIKMPVSLASVIVPPTLVPIEFDQTMFWSVPFWI